jgi:hypothetical protein
MKLLAYTLSLALSVMSPTEAQTNDPSRQEIRLVCAGEQIVAINHTALHSKPIKKTLVYIISPMISADRKVQYWVVIEDGKRLDEKSIYWRVDVNGIQSSYATEVDNQEIKYFSKRSRFDDSGSGNEAFETLTINRLSGKFKRRSERGTYADKASTSEYLEVTAGDCELAKQKF